MSLASGAALLAGVGPGLGAHLARLLAAEGRDLQLLGRHDGLLQDLAGELVRPGVQVGRTVVDLTDDDAVRAAVLGAAIDGGPFALVHVNPSTWRAADPLELTPAQLLDDVAVGVGSVLSVVQAAHPHLVPGGRVLVTGSSAADEPSYDACSLGVQKAGVRNLVQSLDARLAPEGHRATSLTVRGVLGETGPFSYAAVARALRDAVDQPDEEWRSELHFEGEPHPPGAEETD